MSEIPCLQYGVVVSEAVHAPRALPAAGLQIRPYPRSTHSHGERDFGRCLRSPRRARRPILGLRSGCQIERRRRRCCWIATDRGRGERCVAAKHACDGERVWVAGGVACVYVGVVIGQRWMTPQRLGWVRWGWWSGWHEPLMCAASAADLRSSPCACALCVRRRGAWALASRPPAPADRTPPPPQRRARRSRDVCFRIARGNARGVCHVRGATADPNAHAIPRCHGPEHSGRRRARRVLRARALLRVRGAYATRWRKEGGGAKGAKGAG